MAKDTIVSPKLGKTLHEETPNEQGDKIYEEKDPKCITDEWSTSEQLTSQQPEVNDENERDIGSEKVTISDRVQVSEHGIQQLTEGQQPLREPEPEYSVFSKNEKRCIVMMATMAAAFSPISTNIFFPALNTLASDLRVSDSLINLTVTSYMVGMIQANPMNRSSLIVWHRFSKPLLLHL